MDRTASRSVQQPTNPTVVDTDHPCRKCKYNLRTLAVSASCPECGHPVADSLRHDRPPLGPVERCLAAGLVAASCFVPIATVVIEVVIRPSGRMRPNRPDWLLYFLLVERTFWTAGVILVVSIIAALACPALRQRWWFWLAVGCCGATLLWLAA